MSFTFGASVSPYSGLFNNAVRYTVPGTQTETPTTTKPPIGTPTTNTTGNTITYKTTGLLSGILGIDATVPSGIVSGLGTTAIIGGLVLAYILLK